MWLIVSTSVGKLTAIFHEIFARISTSAIHRCDRCYKNPHNPMSCLKPCSFDRFDTEQVAHWTFDGPLRPSRTDCPMRDESPIHRDHIPQYLWCNCTRLNPALVPLQDLRHDGVGPERFHGPAAFLLYLFLESNVSRPGRRIESRHFRKIEKCCRPLSS